MEMTDETTPKQDAFEAALAASAEEISSAAPQEPVAAETTFVADDLALGLRIALPLQRTDKELAGIHMDQRNIVMIAEERHHFFRLSSAHQAVIDKHGVRVAL